jgi:hypothetical protein
MRPRARQDLARNAALDDIARNNKRHLRADIGERISCVTTAW